MLNLNFNPFPVIHTERLVLRELVEDDLPELFYQRSDPQILKYLDRKPDQTVEDTRGFFARIKAAQLANEGITWGITLKSEPRLIGNICIWRIDEAHHRAEIGYALHPIHHGKGLMHEAMTAIIAYAFRTMKLHSLEANVNPQNHASIRLLERSHFVKEAHFKENYFYDDRYLDSAIYSLVAPPANA